jgi:tRNA (guanine37-N1)-methyltransferase
MRVDIITIFPSMFQEFFSISLLGKAVRKDILSIYIHDLRDYANDPHKTVDDTTYGGGSGMVMKPEPIFSAVEAIASVPMKEARAVVLFTPCGGLLKHQELVEFSRYSQLILICGRYEGVDERVRQHLITHEVSIGDYVLSGGELPAMVFIEALSRQLPGVVGNVDSVKNDSFYNGLLDYPHYTRPSSFRDHDVPSVLQSGDHKEIDLWRKKMALKMTLERRPDLLANARLNEEDRLLLARLHTEASQDGSTGRN